MTLLDQLDIVVWQVKDGRHASAGRETRSTERLTLRSRCYIKESEPSRGWLVASKEQGFASPSRQELLESPFHLGEELVHATTLPGSHRRDIETELQGQVCLREALSLSRSPDAL